MQKWEYRRVTRYVENGNDFNNFDWMQEVGEEGWELVTTMVYTYLGSERVKFFFKRPLVEVILNVEDDQT